MLEAKTSDEFGPDLEVLPFGMKVRYSRIHIKMSTERSGILYAKAIGREKPYTARRMEQMELHDGFPKDKTRRWAIAQIVQMGLFFKLSSLGIDLAPPEAQQRAYSQSKELKKELQLDITDHQTFLQQGWTQGFQGTLEEAEEEIFTRIYDIHDKAPYASDKQKTQAWRTLCGFHIMLASDIYGARNDAQAMTKQTNLAVILAKENKFLDLYAIALLQRGVFFMDQGNFPLALHDFQAAQRIKHVPQQLQGKILASAGRAKARLAQTREERDEALETSDEAESMIEKSTLDDFGFLVAFGEDKYKLERGEALIGSPLKQFRSPETALSYLPEVYRVDQISNKELFRTIGHRQAHNHILQAEIQIDLGQYPIAVALAEEALTFAVGVQSSVHLRKLVHVCNLLKKSPYGNSIEVAMLEIGIMRNLRPELFN
jgi:tetratricopeptide (TPR) repeat protein